MIQNGQLVDLKPPVIGSRYVPERVLVFNRHTGDYQDLNNPIEGHDEKRLQRALLQRTRVTARITYVDAFALDTQENTHARI